MFSCLKYSQSFTCSNCWLCANFELNGTAFLPLDLILSIIRVLLKSVSLEKMKDFVPPQGRLQVESVLPACICHKKGSWHFKASSSSIWSSFPQSIGEFVLTHPDIKMKPKGKAIYSVNEGNAATFEEPVTKYLESIKFPKVWLASALSKLLSCQYRVQLYGNSARQD